MRGTVLAAAACVVAACTGSGIGASGASGSATAAPAGAGTAAASPAGLGPSGPHPAAAWPQFDQNAARTGVAVGLRAAGALTTAWTAPLDGAVYGQPLVVGGNVIAATENDTVYAISRATGKTVWHTHVGTPVPQSALQCGDIDPLGITGTPIYDQSNGLVYAVAETTGYHHILFGLSVATGQVEVTRDLNVSSAANQPAYYQQRPALAIDAGRVYAAFGGLAGDCGAYIGGVVGVALNGKGALVSWHTPTAKGGAVWGTGGPVAGPHGELWVSTGNGAAGPGAHFDGSDSVTFLSPTLHRLQYFAPATWAADNAGDLDLGSSQPVRASGNATFAMGKRGIGYLLATPRLGGIGGQLASAAICKPFGAAADLGPTVYEPCGGGMAAISVSAAKKRITVLWRGPADGNGSPVIGGGAVWITARYGSGGRLYELDQATGAVRHQIAIDAGLPHFSSLSLGGSSAYLGTLSGVTAIGGA